MNATRSTEAPPDSVDPEMTLPAASDLRFGLLADHTARGTILVGIAGLFGIGGIVVAIIMLSSPDERMHGLLLLVLAVGSLAGTRRLVRRWDKKRIASIWMSGIILRDSKLQLGAYRLSLGRKFDDTCGFVPIQEIDAVSTAHVSSDGSPPPTLLLVITGDTVKTNRFDLTRFALYSGEKSLHEEVALFNTRFCLLSRGRLRMLPKAAKQTDDGRAELFRPCTL